MNGKGGAFSAMEIEFARMVNHVSAQVEEMAKWQKMQRLPYAPGATLQSDMVSRVMEEASRWERWGKSLNPFYPAKDTASALMKAFEETRREIAKANETLELSARLAGKRRH